MRLYLDARTNFEDTKDLTIDYIEVQLNSGESISLNWDESEFGIEDGVFSARYKGVYFDEEYANGRIEELEGMIIKEIGFYMESDEPLDFIVTDMIFEDEDKELTFENPYAVLKDIPITDNIYDIHVTYGPKDGEGYSIFVSGVLNEESALKKAAEEAIFEEPEDINRIDYVEKISLEEFLGIKGIDMKTPDKQKEEVVVNPFKLMPQEDLVDVLTAYDAYMKTAKDCGLLKTTWEAKTLGEFLKEEYQSVWLKGEDFSYLKDEVSKFAVPDSKVYDPLMDFIENEVPFRLDEILELKPSKAAIEHLIQELKDNNDIMFDYDEIDDFLRDQLEQYKELYELDDVNREYHLTLDEMPEEVVVELPDGTVASIFLEDRKYEDDDFEYDDESLYRCYIYDKNPTSLKDCKTDYEDAAFTSVFACLEDFLNERGIAKNSVKFFDSMEAVFEKNSVQVKQPLQARLEEIESQKKQEMKEEKEPSLSEKSR